MAEIHMLFRRYFRFAIHFFTFGFFIFLKLINVFRARILTALRMVIGGISHGILLATAAFGIVVGIFSTALFAQTCTVGSAVGSYGTVDVLPGLAVPASTSFTVNCTGTAGNIVRLCINISYGTSANLSTSPRIMTSGTNNLNHELYIDSGHGTIFGSPLNPYFQTYAGTFVQYDVTIGAGGSTTTPPFNVYGQVLGSQQTALPGTYNWNTGTPGVQYAIKTATACPTGNKSVIAGAGSSIWTATIAAKCNLSATDINFGSVGLLTANVDATGTLNVQCTNTTPYTVSINGGLSGATNPALRKMTLSTNSVTYGIYSDIARATAWGSLAGATIAGTGTGLTQSLTMYGRVPPQSPTPPPGNYSDTLIATITY